MLLACKPRSAYPSSQAIGEQLCNRSRILVSNHTGNRPADRRMLRRKRGSALKKTSPAVADKGAVPSGRVFEDFGLQECTDSGFSCEQSGFALTFVLGEVSPKKHSSPSANKSGE